MFPDLEFIKTCLNGLRSRIEKVEKSISQALASVKAQLKENAEAIKSSTADWEQNDSTSPSYIQNRPFFDDRKYGKTVEATIVMNSTKKLESIDSEAWELLVSDNHPIIVSGEAIFQYYDKSDSTITFRLVTSEMDSTSCYFIYVSTESQKACWYNRSMPDGVSGSSQIQIKEVLNGKVQKIDRNFLPEIILVDPYGTKWNVYVDDSGAIKTKAIYV